MSINRRILESWKNSKLRKDVKTRFFWMSLGFAGLIAALDVIGMSNVQYFYLQIPFAILMASILPAAGASVFYLKFGRIIAKLHRFSHYPFIKKENYFLKLNEGRDTSVRRFALINILYSIGITFAFLKGFGISSLNDQTTAILMAMMLFSLIISSGLNMSIYIIRRLGIFFKSDGGEINLASDLQKRSAFIASPIQIGFFIYSFRLEGNFVSFIIVLGISFAICFSTSLFSMKIVKRHYINKMQSEFIKKIDLIKY